MIVPYLESVKLSYDYGQPWNALANKPFERCAGLFCWDQAPRPGEEMSTTVFGIVGPGALFDESRTERLQIDESTGDLICAIEVRNSGVHWMQPGDLDYRELIALERAGKLDLGIIDGGFAVLFLNGGSWRLRADTPREKLIKFMTIDEAKQFDAEEVLGEYRVR